MPEKKIDNSNLTAKLELRRHFLRKYHADEPPHVLDCCQGDGVIWKRLREEFPVTSYWGVDVKLKKGRVKLDSVRILAQPGWPQNVIDIDTYGSPWKHWAAMLLNVERPMTVFLTIGKGFKALTVLDKVCLRAIGIPDWLYSRLPLKFRSAYIFGEMCVSAMLTSGCDYVRLHEVVETVASKQDNRYIGIRLEPKTNGLGGATPGRSEHPQAVEEPEHV